MTAVPEKFTTIQLVKAGTAGWNNHYNLNAQEITLLQCVATWGDRSVPGLAFAYNPIVGAEAWARQMGMSRPSFFRAKKSLVAKGLLMEIDGTRRFPGVKGVAIPVSVMIECAVWASNRDPLARPIDIDPNDITTTTESHFRDSGVSEVRLSSLTCETQAPPLTCGNAAHTPEEPERDPTSYEGDACASPESDRKNMPFYRGDEWAESGDDDSSWAEPSDRPEKPKRRAAPTSRLAQHFWDEWILAREEYPNLAVAWSVKKAFLANLKRLLLHDTEEALAEQITQFFRLVRSGKVATRSDELWKDFLTHRGASVRARQRGASELSGEDYIKDLKARLGQA